jgi:hypothetical protein
MLDKKLPRYVVETRTLILGYQKWKWPIWASFMSSTSDKLTAASKSNTNKTFRPGPSERKLVFRWMNLTFQFELRYGQAFGQKNLMLAADDGEWFSDDHLNVKSTCRKQTSGQDHLRESGFQIEIDLTFNLFQTVRWNMFGQKKKLSLRVVETKNPDTRLPE